MHKRNYGLTADKEAGGGKCLNDDNVSIATFPIEARGGYLGQVATWGRIRCVAGNQETEN